MALFGKELQMVDTFNVTFVVTDVDGIARKLFSGSTSKAGLDSKADKIEVFSGIGQQKKFSMYTKKDMFLDVEIESFDIDYIASKNGVTIDKASKTSYYIGKEVAVTTASATIPTCSRVINVQDVNGNDLKIVSTTPTVDTEVKVAIAGATATLTLKTGSTATKLIVTYEGDSASGKDNYTVNFYATAFPKGGELICNSVVYDSTPALIADVYLNFWSCALDPNGTLDFSMGKATKIPAKFEILVPKYTPTGALNLDGKTGAMVITER